MTRDKPTPAEFQKFWSVFEAKQHRKRQQLAQQKGTQHGETKA